MRLIDADELMEKTIGVVVYDEGGWDCNVHAVPDHVVENAPTIEAEPVRHGRWERSVSMVRSAKCSECRMWITKHSVNEPDFRYCPHCGAKMDGGADDGP